MNDFFRGFLLVSSALALAACAAGGAGASKKSGAITAESRAAERWELLIGGKPAEAYAYFSPGFRSTKARDAYVKEFAEKPVKWLKATVLGENCEEDSCTVDVEVEYKVDLQARGVGTVQVPHREQERWVRLDGTWYYVPEDVVTGGLR
jgi:uncharacterized protein YchJ